MSTLAHCASIAVSLHPVGTRRAGVLACESPLRVVVAFHSIYKSDYDWRVIQGVRPSLRFSQAGPFIGTQWRKFLEKIRACAGMDGFLAWLSAILVSFGGIVVVGRLVFGAANKLAYSTEKPLFWGFQRGFGRVGTVKKRRLEVLEDRQHG